MLPKAIWLVKWYIAFFDSGSNKSYIIKELHLRLKKKNDNNWKIVLYVFRKGSCDKDIDIDDVQSKIKTSHVDVVWRRYVFLELV